MLCPPPGYIAGMIARLLRFFEGRVLFPVNPDDPDVCERMKHGRAGPHENPRGVTLARGLADTLTNRVGTVNRYGHRVLKSLTNPFSARGFTDQDQHRFPSDSRLSNDVHQ